MRRQVAVAAHAVLSESTPLLDRLQRFCSLLARELEGGVCSLYLRETDPERMRLRASSTTAGPLDAPVELLPGEGRVGWVSQQRQPLHLRTLAGHAEVHDWTLPVEASGELFGVLSLEGAHEPGGSRLLHDRIDACVELLGRNLADARREARTEREAQRAAAIKDTAVRMGSCREAAELYHLIAARAALILETDHAVLRLRDESSQALGIRAYFGCAEAESQPPLFRLEQAFSAATLQSGRGHRTNELDPQPGSDAYDAGVSNLMQEPITVAGALVGTLSVLEKHSGELVGETTFSEEDAAVLRQLVLHAGQQLSRIEEASTTGARQRRDPATGLADRTQFGLRLDRELVRSRDDGHPLSLIRLRINGLGELPSRRGQPEADRVAREITRGLEDAVRDFDVVARTDPETFELLIPDPDEEISSLIGSLARRTGELLRQLEERSGERLKLEFGYARFPEDGETRAVLTAQLEQARLRSFG
ncbi:MAG: diguanylate cyclase [Myxococcales bacterium]|nr:diguanylate cyclase [Myxococcales bacterium]